MNDKSLIEEWQDELSRESDTRKYRLIMRTIAFLQSVQPIVVHHTNQPAAVKDSNGVKKAHS